VPIALDQVSARLESPSLMLLGETARYWPVLRETVGASQATAGLVHARVAALCRHHGVRELWSADRHFSRFPQVTVRNPLVE
jgi:hypothetical protein